MLFPELDRLAVTRDDTDYEPGVSDGRVPERVEVVTEDVPEDTWVATQDIVHDEYGHGWVQGTGHGVVSVRFETRATGPGKTRSFAVNDPALHPGDPLDSLDWADWLAADDELADAPARES